MPPLNIPRQELPKLRELTELPKEQFDSLASAIAKMRPTLTPRQFASRLSKSLPSPAAYELLPILNTLLSLYWIKDSRHYSVEEMAEAVSQSAVEASSDKNQFPREKRELLRDRLTVLLGFDNSLGVTAKAYDVMTEHEHIFCGARILSDIRPVFTSTPESASGAVIIHNLQIAFHSSGEHREFYVALDTDDIKKLKEVIARTEKKTAALQAILNKANVPYLEV